MPGWVSPWELLILVFVILLVFGPKRLPEMGRGLGRGMREFKDSITGKDREHPQVSARAPAGGQAPVREQRPPAPVHAREHDTV